MLTQHEHEGEIKIPVGAQVQCQDGPCGRSTRVVINPVSERVTHLVVKEEAASTEHMVPVSSVASATDEVIQLRCTKQEMQQMTPFAFKYFGKETRPVVFPMPSGYEYRVGDYLFWPYAAAEYTAPVVDENLRVPPGELTLQRGTHVEATDGHVGEVDEFLINPATGNISHLVIRGGPAWGKRDVCIPASAIRKIGNDAILLSLDKYQVGSLPPIQVRGRRSKGA